MDEAFFMMSHVLFGVGGTLLAVALLMDILNVREGNLKRIRVMSLLMAGLMVAAYLIGGDFYVDDYAADKAIILAGAWPWAHEFFMEVKEHLFFILIMLSLYLPLVVFSRRLAADAGIRKLALSTLGAIVALGLTMDGFGAIIAMGVRMGLKG